MYTILIVEDNPSDSQIMCFLVNKMRHMALAASDPHEALELTQKYKIDMILLDWMLPNISGLQLLKTFKLQEKLKNIPIILVSGKNEQSDVEKAIKSGAVDYLVKPIDPIILEGKVNKHLKQNIDWVPIRISNVQHSKASITHEVKLESISELGVEILTEIEMSKGTSFILSNAIFTEIQIQNPIVCIFDSEKLDNIYRYKCSLVGMKEVDLQKIRLHLRLIQIETTPKAA